MRISRTCCIPEDLKVEEHQGSSSLGSFNFNQEDVEDTEQYQAIKWDYDKVNWGPKLIKWGDVADKQDTHVTKTTYELNTFESMSTFFLSISLSIYMVTMKN